ncbi:zinc finger protein 385A [Emys orbicularis]|uniref:zinc finger protein 385A n=1 Tax=Emys orbicularis TaxID=82168 RepID=UPI0031FC9A09
MLRAPPAMIQPPLDIKHFLPFPMEAQPAVGLFPGFSTMDPVQKAVINHTFGAPLSKARRPVISCNVCQIRFNSESQAEAHYKGNRHARRVKGMEAAKTRQKESGPREGDKPGPPPPPGELPLTVPPPRPGTKHKTILEARSGLGPIKAYPRLGPTASGEPGSQDPNAQERTFHCEICNVKVNSEIQLKQHISSRRHRDGVAGKPNPLLSRHKKQRSSAELGGPLAFPKDLPKSLAAGLLPSPLAMAAAMAAAASAPLTLRPTPPLLQGPPLTHPLLRPAPGPIRTAHGPILFSPY